LESMVNGIWAAMPDPEAVLAYIRGLLPSNPARWGPLSEPVDWGFLGEGLQEALAGIGQQMRGFEPQLAVAAMPTSAPPRAPVGGSRQLRDITVNVQTLEPASVGREVELALRRTRLQDLLDAGRG